MELERSITRPDHGSSSRRRQPARFALRTRRRATDEGSPFLMEGPSRTEVMRRDARYRRALVAADALAAIVAIWVAIVVLGDDDALRPTWLLAAPIAVLASKVAGLYDRDEVRLRKSTLDEVPALAHLATTYALGVVLARHSLIQGDLGGDQIVAMWALLLACTVLGRGAARALVSLATPPERCIVVGTAATSATVAAKLRAGHGVNTELVGELPFDLTGIGDEGLRRLESIVRELDVQRVVLTPGEGEAEHVLDAVRLLKALGLKVTLVPRILEVVGSSVVFDGLDGMTVLGVRRFGLSRSSKLIKRGIDVAVSGFLLACAAPAFALIALLVRLDSDGPIFFRQTRVGRGGRHFDILKFRTMVPGAEALKASLVAQNEADGLFKIAADPRITRVGRLLRRSSLDELPQLLNVLLGDMSLVGPRPLVVDEDQKIEGWHRRRLHLTPGMTGPWQVLGSSRIPLSEMVIIDYLYVANWTLFEDVKVLLRTVLHVLRRSGR